MISIIVPFYNPEQDSGLELLLGRAIASAAGQFGSDDEYEIIVVDDGSPEPPEAMKEFQDRHVSLIKAVHGRLGAARNRGIEASHGDIIAFLDADDYYFPNSLKQCLQAMEMHDADLLQFSFRECRGGIAADTGTDDVHFSAPVTGSGFMKSHTPFGSSCLYLIRRSLLADNDLRFAENTFMEDEEFTPRLLFFSRRLVVSDAAVYAYCYREGSITASISGSERAANTLHIMKLMQDFRQKHLSSDISGFERKMRFVAMDCMRQTLRRPDWREAVPHVTSEMSAIGLWPPSCHAGYGIRYNLFAVMSRLQAGRFLLQLNERRYIR